jgi:DNA-binding NarL/FixJ family response regulator
VKNTETKSKFAQALRLLAECGCTFESQHVENHLLRVSVPHWVDRKALGAICNAAIVEPQIQNGQVVAALTPQQAEVLLRISAAKPNKQIAFEMGISETTVKAHATNIYRRLGVRNRAEALLFTQR